MAVLILWAVLVAGTMLLACALSASASSGDVQRHTLSNGLDILVQEDHSAPLICSFIWYRVGLRHEGPGEAGLSHFMEHMAFKGTERFSGREQTRLVTAQGGYLNGFTSMDYTAYVETLPRDALDLALDIESDRMSNCLLDTEDIEAEKGVVLSEFEGAENDPAFLLRRKVMATQFAGQPYGRTVIGEKDDLRALGKEQVASYYERHYAPNNAALVVVGDIQAEEVFAKAEEFFGPIPRAETDPPAPNPGRGPTGERRVKLELPGRTSYLQAVYEVPPIQHLDHVVLEVFQNVVSGGRTSRLYKALVHTGLASQAGGWDYENPEPTVFAFEVALRPGVEHQQAENALDSVLDRLREEPVSEHELQKAKNQTKAHFVYAADGVTKLAQQIGYYHIIHDYDYLHAFPETVDMVTAEDIQRMARTYFTPENRTVGWLVATGQQDAGALGGGAYPLDVRWRHHRDAWDDLSADRCPSPLPVPPGLGPVPSIHELKLANGMRVLLQENHAAPFIAIYGNIVAGPTFDPPGKAGLAAFCAEMLSRGTEKRTWPEIREDLEFAAAGLALGTGIQVATVSGRCLKEDLKLLLDSAAEQLVLPSFPPDEIEKVRSEIIAGQERRDEDTMRVAEKEFLAQLYPEGHPLHYPRLGTAETVAAITRDDLVAFHSRYYRPENTLLAIVGDMHPEAVERLVNEAFADWKQGGKPASPELPAVPLPSETRVVRVPLANKTQADIALGFPGISRRDPDYYPADLMNYVLGSGFMSRLNMRIREDMGLAYYVWSAYRAYWGPGPWILQMGVNPENVDKALSAAIEELERIQKEPPSAEEMKLWKDYAEGTVARRMETFSGIAQNLMLSAFYDLGAYFPYEYPTILRDITAEQVHEAAHEFLHPTGYVAVIAGPLEETGEQ